MILCTMPGCQTTAGCQCNRYNFTGARLKARNAIIEECARVADRIEAQYHYKRDIAAAIRALKDKR